MKLIRNNSKKVLLYMISTNVLLNINIFIVPPLSSLEIVLEILGLPLVRPLLLFDCNCCSLDVDETEAIAIIIVNKNNKP